MGDVGVGVWVNVLQSTFSPCLKLLGYACIYLYCRRCSRPKMLNSLDVIGGTLSWIFELCNFHGNAAQMFYVHWYVECLLLTDDLCAEKKNTNGLIIIISIILRNIKKHSVESSFLSFFTHWIFPADYNKQHSQSKLSGRIDLIYLFSFLFVFILTSQKATSTAKKWIAEYNRMDIKCISQIGSHVRNVFNMTLFFTMK